MMKSRVCYLTLSFTFSCAIFIFQSPVIVPTSISLSLSATTIVLGAGLDLYAEVLPLEAINKKVVWLSSDSSVASVVDGHVLARSLGTVSIRAITEIGSHIDSCVITVILPDVPVDDPVDDPEDDPEDDPVDDPVEDPEEDPTDGIIIDPVVPSDPSSPVGSVDISFPVPVDASFASSFVITLPLGFELDLSVSALAIDLRSEYELSITSLFPFSWLFSITSKSSSVSAASINLQSAEVPKRGCIALPWVTELAEVSELAEAVECMNIPGSIGVNGVFPINLQSTVALPLVVSSSSGSTALINLQSSATSRPIVTIGYTTSVSLPVGFHTMKISDLVATFSDGTSLHRSEILVNITTVNTSTLLLPAPTVIVSLSSAILTVTSPSSETLTIYSLSGSLLYKASKDQGSTSINIAHLPRGVWIIHGSSGWVRKIIRQ